MTRRSRKALEAAISESTTAAGRARAYYELGLFHDNNGREAAAIPCYEAALALGLDAATRARCLAWLASSLYKTGRPAEAMSRASEAETLATDVKLSRFLRGLKRRIARTAFIP